MKQRALVDIHKSLAGVKEALKELKPDTPIIKGAILNSIKTMAMLMKELEEQGKQYNSIKERNENGQYQF